MLDFRTFVEQANGYGAQGKPFFFLIDFEQQQPLISPFHEALEAELLFDIQGISNVEATTSMNSPLQFSKQPMEKAEYTKGFNLVKQEIQKGNSYLLNLTYPTLISLNIGLEEVFWRSQAPYKLCYRNRFVCFSPETFIKIVDDRIYTYPMKGTIDASLPDAKSLLLNSEKEKQEHYTIVDLMRNDLALVAKNIEVLRFRYVDQIQTQKGAILQTSSEICGQLAENWRSQIGTILSKLLPAGSISGAPKEKTVQIIKQAEGQPRGYYTGVFGVFDGEQLQSAVAIRFIEQREGKFWFRSGGGVTMLSELDDEYLELQQKVYLPFK
ncbi:aminodeoxychorismate synthase component I [[Haemophilus] felis]|nr:aminodeoxychorismate synthase component I [[Haemophilus] felis]